MSKLPSDLNAFLYEGGGSVTRDELESLRLAVGLPSPPDLMATADLRHWLSFEFERNPAAVADATRYSPPPPWGAQADRPE